MAGYRINRVSEDIRREIISAINNLKDPRISGKMISVVKVETSSDASYSKVYVSSVYGMDCTKEAVKGLKNASGYIRHEIGKNLKLKKVPELTFIPDDSIEHGMDIAKILDELRVSDETD